MKYLLLIVRGGQYEPTPPEPWFDYTDAMRQAGVMVAGEALEAPETCRLVTPTTGTTTDGPFAETKEHMGGFYLIDVDSQEEAEEWAMKMPTNGPVEVWPVMTFE